MDELHSYESYGWTIFVCCTSYLRIYFIYIQVTDSLHPYVKKNRSIRTSVTQKNVYLRRNQTNTSNTFTSIEPQPLSTKENDHEWEKPDHNDKSKRKKKKKKPPTIMPFKRKTGRGIFIIYKICWVHQQ